MKKIVKIVLPLGVLGLMSGCCSLKTQKQQQPIVYTPPVYKQKVVQPIVYQQPIYTQSVSKKQVIKPKVVKTCNTCPKVTQNQKQNQKQIVNVNIKVKPTSKKNTKCELAQDAPIAPYIDNY